MNAQTTQQARDRNLLSTQVTRKLPSQRIGLNTGQLTLSHWKSNVLIRMNSEISNVICSLYVSQIMKVLLPACAECNFGIYLYPIRRTSTEFIRSDEPRPTWGRADGQTWCHTVFYAWVAWNFHWYIPKLQHNYSTFNWDFATAAPRDVNVQSMLFNQQKFLRKWCHISVHHQLFAAIDFAWHLNWQ